MQKIKPHWSQSNICSKKGSHRFSVVPILYNIWHLHGTATYGPLFLEDRGEGTGTGSSGGRKEMLARVWLEPLATKDRVKMSAFAFTWFTWFCMVHQKQFSINQSMNQTSIVPISPVKPGSVAQQPNQCSTAKSRKQFRNINRPWGVAVSMGKRPNQRDVSWDIS